MKTRRRLSILSAALAFAGACASTSPTLDGNTDLGSLNGAKVEITAEGGFAALSVVDRVEHDTRGFAYTSWADSAARHAARRWTPASGTLSPSRTDSLFSTALAQKSKFQDDYGTTNNAADMMTYTVIITSDGHVRTIHADDGTMPGALRQIVERNARIDHRRSPVSR